MEDKAGGVVGRSVRAGKYSRVERERRFLLARPPKPSAVTARRVITDRYVVGTRLRLRRADFADGRCELKLTQKVPLRRPGAVQGLITNTYLSPAEYHVLASLPAALLSKTRFSVPPLGVDVFDGRLQGLVLAEAEFTSDTEAQSFVPPAECVAEVTDDARFTGGRLVQTSRQELLGWLAEYGLHPGSSEHAAQ
jgi:CYTH domain-containing protein